MVIETTSKVRSKYCRSIVMNVFIFFQISPDDDDEFVPLLQIIDSLKDNINEPRSLAAFSIKHFLPRDLAGFYRYEGSLTTPNCNEGVVWTVFTNTIPISKKQVNSSLFI